MKEIIKQLIPPLFLQMLRPFKVKQVDELPGHDDSFWKGNYTSWQEAVRQSGGYDDHEIIQKCRDSLSKVRDGQAAYERDSVLFDEIHYSWPLLACLENIALQNENSLHVVDFGGSLGSSYFQNRHFLKGLRSLQWTVVEQKHFVDCGKKEFEDDILKFEYSVEDILHKQKVHCLLLSGVLQYLSEPFKWIEKLCNYNIEFVILDRTGFVDGFSDLLTIQKVPQEIYHASYPCWFFNEHQFLSHFSKQYNKITDFNDSFTPPIHVNEQRGYWKGFYLKAKAYDK